MLSHAARRCGSAGGYLPAKDRACAGIEALGFAMGWSRTGRVAPIFAIALAFHTALELQAALDTGLQPALDTGVEGLWALPLAIFASCSTAAAVLRAAAAKAIVLLEVMP